MKSISHNCLSLIKILQVSDLNVDVELEYIRNFNRWKKVRFGQLIFLGDTLPAWTKGSAVWQVAVASVM